MAINLPIVTQFSDKGLKAAKAAFANFKTDVSNATGSMGKFKAGSNSALNAVKANAGAFALAAGTAITGFAVKAVGEFQTLALESGKFADATGLSVEEASRWKEVGGDIGIGSDAIQGAIGKMNKALGSTPQLFSELGVDIVKTDTGLNDVNGTFLAVIDRLREIKDPAERARVAALLLGKGWQDMAQFINIGSSELKKSLDSVASGQVISDKELKKAQEFRDTMDEFGDMWSSFVINVGGWVAQFATDIGNVIDLFVHPMGTFRSIGLEVMGWFSDTPAKVKVYAKEMRAAREEQDFLNQSLKELKDGGLDGFVSGFENAAVAMASATSEWKILTGVLDTAIALEEVQGQLAGVEAAAAKAFASGKDSDIQKYIELELQFITGLSGIASGMDNISNKEIVLAFRTDGRQAAIDLAKWLSQGGEAGNLNIEDALTLAGIPGRAIGGPVSGGSSYLVGERGPEIFTPLGSGMITPNSAIGGPVSGGSSYIVEERGPEIFTPSSSGMITPNSAIGGNTITSNSAIGGNTITINVQGADPQAVVRALQDYNRTAGPIPVNTRGN